MTEILIGRERETSELRRCMDSVRSEFVIVYGRRRVGKTFLVDQFFHGRYDFAYTGGHRMSKARQLRYFAKSLKEYAHLPKQPVFRSWDDAFDALQQHLESLCSDRRKVIFIDEMPWIDTPQSEFVAALEMFWNGWASRRGDIVLIASGSSTSWMVDKLVRTRVDCTLASPATSMCAHSRCMRWSNISKAVGVSGTGTRYYKPT